MEAALSLGEALNPEGCLFCRRHDGGFRSEEHIFSQGLGNTTYVLPPGIVCDRCNNGPLSVADHALTDFSPIVLLRAERGLPTKAGKPVAAKFGNATVYFSAPGELVVETNSKKATRRMAPGGGQLDLTSGGPMTATRFRSMARAVWKSALELVYLDYGPSGSFDPVFDSLRRHVLGEGGTEGWMVCPKNGEAHNHVELRYETRFVEGRKACPAMFDIFGFRLYTDLLRRDLKEAYIESTTPWPANVWVF